MDAVFVKVVVARIRFHAARLAGPAMGGAAASFMGERVGAPWRLRSVSGRAGLSRKLKAADVIDVLSDLFILRGIPGHRRSDNVLCREGIAA